MSPGSYKLEGIGVSAGFAFGRAHFVDRSELPIPHLHISVEDIADEVERFEEARTISCTQLEALKHQMQNAGEEHYLILDTHLLMLADPTLIDGARRLIREEGYNAEWALHKHAQEVLQLFEHQEDIYFQERRADIGFVVDRFMRNLLGADQPNLDNVNAGDIVIARDLSPSDMASLVNSGVAGFVTEVGGQTSHTAIMARSIELPAVVAVEGLTDRIATGDNLIVDAGRGAVLVNPPESEIARLKALAGEYAARKADIDAHSHEGSVTQDGVDIAIWGNIESSDEAEVILDHGASAVGLFRTEYLFIGRRKMPDEEEQYEHYRKVVETLGTRVATIRTIDLGGDKFAENLRVTDEANPAMGTRAIRFCLTRAPMLFRTQLRALLRAAAHGKLRVMIPFINNLAEVKEAKAILEDVRQELISESVAIGTVEFGIMVELPAAALLVDILAQEVDFLSIGTNDLIQYSLGVDRANPNVAYLYAAEHPAILRLIQHVLDKVPTAESHVSMCGEMAGYPHSVPLLIGMGLRTLSVSPTAIPLVKAMIRELSLPDCEALAADIFGLHEAESIRRRLFLFMKTQYENTKLSPILKPLWSPALKSKV